MYEIQARPRHTSEKSSHGGMIWILRHVAWIWCMWWEKKIKKAFLMTSFSESWLRAWRSSINGWRENFASKVFINYNRRVTTYDFPYKACFRIIASNFYTQKGSSEKLILTRRHKQCEIIFFMLYNFSWLSFMIKISTCTFYFLLLTVTFFIASSFVWKPVISCHYLTCSRIIHWSLIHSFFYLCLLCFSL